MSADAELLKRYANDREEAAFAELVRRHVDLVHSAAMRQTNGDAHLAADVTQLVFADLARKAGALAGERVLAGWLFVSTRYAAAKLVRGEQRRRTREQEAHMMQELSDDPAAKLEWERVRPVLDEAMSELGGADREAILLRFFEGSGFAEIGARLQLNENTARMRVERALDKLHALLARRGVTSTTGALGIALANQAVVAAPAGLAVSVAGAVVTGAGAAGGAAATFMSMTKLQLGLTGIVAAAGAGGFVVEHQAAEKWQREVEALRAPAGEVDRLRAENLRLAKAAIEAERRPADEAELARWREEKAVLETQIAAAEHAQRETERVVRQAQEAAAQRALAAKLAAAGQPDRLPQASHRVPPKYPVEMKQAGITGEVLVGFVVDANGAVRDAIAVKSSRPEFESAAIEAVAQWKFEPGVKGHRLVNTRMEQVITFSLAQPDSAAGEPVPVTNHDWF